MVGVPGFEPGSYAPKACMLAVALYPEISTPCGLDSILPQKCDNIQLLI